MGMLSTEDARIEASKVPKRMGFAEGFTTA